MCIRDRGRHDLRRLAGLGAERSDQELADDDLGEDVRLGIERESWEWIEYSGQQCELLDVTAHTTVLQHARLLETRIARLNAPVLDATRSTWRDVELVGSRIGALDVYDAEIRSTRITGTKFDWINLRSSTLEDVLFEDCTIDELDLGAVTASRVAFVNCRAGSVALPHARLEDVDLRLSLIHI